MSGEACWVCRRAFKSWEQELGVVAFAALVKRSPAEVRELLRAGELAGRRTGRGRWRVAPGAVAAARAGRLRLPAAEGARL